jgi:hypothetical protein
MDESVQDVDCRVIIAAVRAGKPAACVPRAENFTARTGAESTGETERNAMRDFKFELV